MFASTGRRIGAFLLDYLFSTILLIAVMVVVILVSEANSDLPWDEITAEEQDRLNDIAVAVWGVPYFIGTWALNATGASIGKRMLGLRIVREDLQAPGIGVGLGRTLAAWLSWPLFGLGFLWGTWDKHGQTWHDKMAGTYVVRRDSLPSTAAVPPTQGLGGPGSLH